jgi:hypothetical protein
MVPDIQMIATMKEMTANMASFTNRFDKMERLYRRTPRKKTSS